MRIFAHLRRLTVAAGSVLAVLAPLTASLAFAPVAHADSDNASPARSIPVSRSTESIKRMTTSPMVQATTGALLMGRLQVSLLTPRSVRTLG